MSRQYYRPGQRNRGRVVPTRRFFLFVTFVAVVVVVVVLLTILVPASFNETNIDSVTADSKVETVKAAETGETAETAADAGTGTAEGTVAEAAVEEALPAQTAHGEVTEEDAAEAAAAAAGEAVEAAIDTSVTYPLLEFGCDDGEAVKKLQTRLIELGYLAAGNDTGHFGDTTEQAVIAFQKNNNLVADGMAGNGTQQVLFSDAAKPKS